MVDNLASAEFALETDRAAHGKKDKWVDDAATLARQIQSMVHLLNAHLRR